MPYGLRLWLDTFQRDVRHSVRLLRKTPAFSLTAIVVLALGIGANAAVFSLINVLMLQPLPGEHRPGAVAGIFSHDPKARLVPHLLVRECETLRERADVFRARHGASDDQARGRADGGDSRRSRAAAVTGNYFATLGVGLVAGRTFSADEERPGSRAAVIVLELCRLAADRRGPTIRGPHHHRRRPGLHGDRYRARGVRRRPWRLAGPEFWMPLGAVDLLAIPAGRLHRPHRGKPRGSAGGRSPEADRDAWMPPTAPCGPGRPPFFKTGPPDDAARRARR